jgi:hypothetical protein
MLEKKFALVAEDDVFMVLVIEEHTTDRDMMIAGLSSNPKVVPIPEDLPVTQYWKYDGSKFYVKDEK